MSEKSARTLTLMPQNRDRDRPLCIYMLHTAPGVQCRSAGWCKSKKGAKVDAVARYEGVAVGREGGGGG